MGAIIALANQKGGVGKTTSAINIAAALGKRRKKVLLIDLDPQGNATSGLGVAKKDITNGIYEVLIGKSAAKDAVVQTKFDNLSIIPSTISLVGAEVELAEEEHPEGFLKTALAELRDAYDYILIDCPPSLSRLTVNALTAADGLIIPMQSEFFALEGLSQLMQTVRLVRLHYNPALALTGILLTMHNRRFLLASQVMRELKKYYGAQLFKPTISRSVKLGEAPSYGEPICYYDPKGKGAKEYDDVARELMLRI